MAEKLADIFAKALAGDITPGYLREVANKEMTALSEAHTASQDPERGWLATLDLLAGETADAKMLDFTERTQKLGEATDWLAKSLAATQAFANLQTGAGASILNMAPAAPRTGEKQATPAEQPMERASLSHYEKMMGSEQSQKLLAMTPEQRQVELRNNPMIAKTSAGDYRLVLKASYGYAGVAAPGGLLPTDRIGMPYPLMTMELDYIPITTSPGSLVRFFQSRQPMTADPDGGTNARARARGAAMNEVTDTGAVIAHTKESLSGYATIAREDLRDNGMIGERNNQQLDIAVRDLMVQQFMLGTGTTPEWNGILADYSTIAATQSAITLTSNQTPVPNTGLNEPVAFMDILFAHLAQRGCPPSVLFVNATDWAKIRQSQRALRYMDEDYNLAPYGRVGPVPMCLSRYLGANQALLVDAEKSFGIELGSDVETAVSEDFQFTSNVIVVRRTVDGNTYHTMPYGGFLITSTDEWVAATP